jgi:hypothetical protein
MFRCLLGLESFDDPKGPLAHKQASLPITFNGIGLILMTIIALAYLRSWALVTTIITVSLMVDQCPFLFEALTWGDNNTIPFQQHLKAACDFLPPLAYTCLLSFEQLIRQQMVRLQNSISKCLHYHIFSDMLFNEIFEAYRTQILSCFGPRAGAWLIVKPIFLSFQLTFLIFFIALRNAPSFNCKYPLMHVHTSHRPNRYPPFTLCSWLHAHKNPWCNSQHLCYHCVGC